MFKISFDHNIRAGDTLNKGNEKEEIIWCCFVFFVQREDFRKEEKEIRVIFSQKIITLISEDEAAPNDSFWFYRNVFSLSGFKVFPGPYVMIEAIEQPKFNFLPSIPKNLILNGLWPNLFLGPKIGFYPNFPNHTSIILPFFFSLPIPTRRLLHTRRYYHRRKQDQEQRQPPVFQLQPRAYDRRLRFMAEETQLREPRKRKFVKNQGRKKSSKKPKVMPPPHGHKKIKIDKKMKKLFHKRAREYNSDDDEEAEEDEVAVPVTAITNKKKEEDVESEDLSEDEGAEARGQKTKKKNSTDMNDNMSEDEGEDDGEVLPGITKFTDGCRAFKMAFRNIIKKSVPDDSLGPVLSGHKKLIAEKLAEEEAERKNRGEARKEKHMLAEKGHVIPANYLDSHEKFLKSVATKGVVKLFNAVNKAQTVQRGLDPSRTKDAKEIRKRTKEAFFTELGKPLRHGIGASAKANASTDVAEDEQPAWAPLRDNYMLTSSRLKDWDKMPDKIVSNDDIGQASEDSSSDED
ncbi:hypothetical protein RIF29_23922 [Crotalaria pallida]|uniref:RRP15-like protein n=1 Tax=Crotalaria pallida TaxID=3830 RepID=A0AAN9EJL1_CROPI